MNFIIYLFYRYYSGSRHTKQVAYSSAILAFLFIIYINVLTISEIINYDTFYFFSDLKDKYGNGGRYVIVFFLVIILHLIFRQFFNKEKIINMQTSLQQRRIGYIALIIYIIFSIGLLIVLVSNR